MNCEANANAACGAQLRQEFQHLQAHWCWLCLYGVLLAVCGTVAVVFPALTILSTITVVLILGISLAIAGAATIVASIWAGKWSGMLVQLLTGILYMVVGFMITDHPLKSALALTMFVATFCIVVGIFRTAAALIVRFPHWGWSLLNGMLTFLLGMIIYRHFPQSGIYLVGLLVGTELILHGWTWITLSLAIKKLPSATA